MNNNNNNAQMNRAKSEKKDEFYTQRADIDNELRHYRDQFRGKVVYCNCDDPRVSHFFKYFSESFERLGLKKLITTCYRNQDEHRISKHDSDKAVYLEYYGDTNKNKNVDDDEIDVKPLKGDGDFRSDECVAMLKESDIVVTNPPFSLFREYVAQLIEHEKKFLIIGGLGAAVYKDIFPLIKEHKIWLGCGFEGGAGYFYSDYEDYAKAGKHIEGMIRIPSVHWFTNMEHENRKNSIKLYRSYTKDEYPTYDNYDAIEVSEVLHIPKDFDGVMGVPVSFLDKWNPEQFEIVGSNRGVGQDPEGVYGRGSILNGEEVNKRLFIKRKS